MNLVYLELCKPLFLKAETNGETTRAEGKVFIHIYPSGYITLHLAISLTWKNGQSLKEFQRILRETNPQAHYPTHWVWSSRIASGSLREILSVVLHNLQRSLYKNASKTPKWQSVLENDGWWRALKIVANAKKEEVVQTLSLKGFEALDAPDCDKEFPNGPPSGEEYIPYSARIWTHIFSSRRDVVCVIRPQVGRKVSLRIFWKTLVFTEFLALKHRIYEDYTEFLRNKITRVKNIRLNIKARFTKEGLMMLYPWDVDTPIFLNALDTFIKSEPKFHRAIYSVLSKGTEFDKRRVKVKERLDELEREADSFEPTIVLILKDMIAPVRALFASVGA